MPLWLDPRPVLQLGKRAQPVTLRQITREDLVGAARYFLHHRAPALRVERIEPGAPGQVFSAVLTRLQKIPPGIAPTQHPLDARTQELLVAQLQRVAALAAIITHQAQRGFEKRFIDRGIIHVL